MNKDSILILYDYGARWYDAGIARWTSVDPMAEKRAWMSPYSYVQNNPVLRNDPTGALDEGPGDLFKRIQDAVKDFAKNYNDNSIVNKSEYATVIYEVKSKDGETKFSYSEPNKGNESSSKPSGSGFTRKDVANAHTHGNYDPKYNNNDFSKADRENANERGRPSFVGTPEGSLKEYDPQTKEVSTISIDIPSDPKDPNRKNNVDPIPLPKNEPTRNFLHFLRDNIIIPIRDKIN